jgi:hypothetical protein
MMNTEYAISASTPSILRKAIKELVRSKLSDGKRAPRASKDPTIRPKKPSGIPITWEITEKAEASQLKKALISQKDPSNMLSG